MPFVSCKFAPPRAATLALAVLSGTPHGRLRKSRASQFRMTSTSLSPSGQTPGWGLATVYLIWPLLVIPGLALWFVFKKSEPDSAAILVVAAAAMLLITGSMHPNS